MSTNEKVESINELQKAMKEAKKETHTKLFQRYLTLFLYLKGKHTVKEIAEIASVSVKTVYNYISLYENGGLKNLTLIHKQTGATCKLTKEQIASLKSVLLNQYPAEVGFPVDYNWTADLIRQYVSKTYNVHYGRSGMTLFLHRIGFSYTRATYVLKKADKEKQEAFKAEFENVKKNYWTMT